MRNSLKSISNIANNLNFQAQNNTTQEFDLPPQAINIVNNLFNDLKGIFTAWKQTFTDINIEQAAKKQWAKALIENGIVNQHQIDFGMKKARKLSKPWFPSSGQFIEWCKPTPENFGLSSVEQALREAAAKIRFTDEQYSHPAVYVAANATGTWELKTMTFDKVLPLFKRNYQIVCERVMRGEDLSLEVPKALPASVSVPTERNKSLNIIGNLKQKLKRGVLR